MNRSLNLGCLTHLSQRMAMHFYTKQIAELSVLLLGAV
jgi:hypothetical protein